jgi:nucleoside-diphosphate-sugar epimerase
MSMVLVTGGSGFLAGHAILKLLDAGHTVRTTLRDLTRGDEVLSNLGRAGADTGGRVTFVAADLNRDEGWADAVKGCEYVLHVASPFPAQAPKDDDELIRPARDGTLRVLRAARDAGVRRLVMTSSFGAVGYGHPPRKPPFTEADWTNLDGKGVTGYIKSKTLAERAAWDFVRVEGQALEFSVVAPVGIFGPVLGPDIGSSVQIIQRMLEGGMPATPRTYFAMVDVRDAADLHVEAMTAPAARGERFLAAAGETVSMLDVAKMLRAGLGETAAAVPKKQLPDAAVHALAVVNPAMRAVASQLGIVRNVSNEKARKVLDWTPRPNAEIVTATGEALLRLGLAKPPVKA